MSKMDNKQKQTHRKQRTNQWLPERRGVQGEGQIK